jgi:hypothetical protein
MKDEIQRTKTKTDLKDDPIEIREENKSDLLDEKFLKTPKTSLYGKEKARHLKRKSDANSHSIMRTEIDTIQNASPKLRIGKSFMSFH